jgi:hypothetical protein
MTPKNAVLTGVGCVLLLIGVLVYSAGAVKVDVREKTPGGHHIWLAVPAIVVPIGARLAPKDKLRDALREARPWLPTIKVASEELVRCPDTSLVEVDNQQEHVRITKRGNALIIDVDSPEESVHVSLPLGVVAYTAGQLESEGPAS